MENFEKWMVAGLAVFGLFLIFYCDNQKKLAEKEDTNIIDIGGGITRYETKDGYVCFKYIKDLSCLKK